MGDCPCAPPVSMHGHLEPAPRERATAPLPPQHPPRPRRQPGGSAMSVLAVGRPSRPGPPSDAGVPELALLSDGALGETLSRLLTTNAVAAAPPRVTYLEYSPGTRLVPQVSLEV